MQGKSINDDVFKPHFFSPPIVAVCFCVLISTGIFGILIIPRMFQIFLEFPDNSDRKAVLFPMLGGIIVCWVIGVLVIAYNLFFRKIEFKENLIFFSHKNISGGWESQIFDLNSIEHIKMIFKTRNYGRFSGTEYFLLITNKDNKKEEVNLDGWDKKSLKEILFKIRSKNKDIKIDTPFFTDSLLVLSGLSDYIKK